MYMANSIDQELKELLQSIDEEDLSAMERSKLQTLEDEELIQFLEEFKKNEEDGFSTEFSEEEDLISGTYQLPLKGGKILSHFVTKQVAHATPGAVASLERHHGGHEAIDVVVPGFNARSNTGYGAPVYPIGPGTVIKVNSSSGENIKGGITCTIQHSSDSNLTSYYAHLSKLNVGVGTQVDSNTVIGFNGNTGSAKGTAPHVHLSTTLNGKRVNPMDIIGKEFGSLSKRSNFHLRLYKVAEHFEELVKQFI